MKKIKYLMTLCVCVAFGCVLAADGNLLRNPDCGEMSPFNLPVGWEVRVSRAEGFKGDSGSVFLDAVAGESEVYLIQRNLPLADKEKYKLDYSVRGQGAYRAYIEYAADRKMTSIGATWQNAPAQWQERSLEIALQPEPTQAKLVFHLRQGAKIELKDMVIAKQETTPGRNLDFSLKKADGSPQFWNVRGGQGAVTFEDGAAILRKTAGDAPFLIQTPLAMAAGQNYRFSAEVKGSGNAGYRFYVEEVMKDGRRKAFGRPAAQAAPADWTPVSFDVSPAADDSRKQLVLNNNSNAGEVRFRNLAIAAAASVTAPPAAKNALTMLGVPVKLSGDSKAGKADKGMPAAVVAFVSNYIPGAVASGIKVEPGKFYELDYLVKGEGLASKGSTGMHFFDVRIDLKDGSELIRSSWDDVMQHSFIPKKFVFKVPENHPGLIDIGMGVTDGSLVSFALVALNEKTIDPAETIRLVITSPAYRDGIYETMPVAKVAGFVEAPGGKAEFRVKRDGKVLAETTGEVVDGKAGFSFDAAIFKAGATEIESRVLDAAGKEMKILSRTITRYPRAGGNEVVIGQDKQFYVNGKLFFPIVQYGMRPDNLRHTEQTDVETVRYVARGGSNVFIFTPKSEADALRLLDLAMENNSMVMFSIGFWRGLATRENAERWGHGVCTLLTPKVLAHPGFFGFYFADEPRWNGVPAVNLQLSAEVLKKITPYHPTHIVAAPRGSVEDHIPYAATADFYGIDIYPVPAGSHSNLDDRTLTSVGKYSRRAEGMVEKRKPILMTLQAFAWGELSKRTLIYPTLAESRFMAYDALLNGATHIAYYSLRHVVTPSFIDVINATTLELHRMSRLLASAEIIADRHENDIQYRVLEFDGKRYVIALNTAGEPRKAVIDAGFRSDKIKVLEENREVAAVKGVVTEEFPAFWIRVYAEAPLPAPLGELPAGEAENPWIKYARQQDSSIPYEGNACWIWSKEITNTPKDEVYLAREFDLKKEVKSVRMLAAADDMGTVWVNGRKAGSLDDWKIMSAFDLTPLVRPGKNLLSVFASDGLAPPCAFLADIDIEYRDGTREKLVTDADWLCSEVEVDGWLTPEVAGKHFKKVGFIVPYGGGRWAKRMKLPQ